MRTHHSIAWAEAARAGHRPREPPVLPHTWEPYARSVAAKPRGEAARPRLSGERGCDDRVHGGKREQGKEFTLRTRDRTDHRTAEQHGELPE
jgi:hypothetical protein